MDIFERHCFAQQLAKRAGKLAKAYFEKHDTLQVDQKGSQDWVSEADRDVELFIRAEIEKSWPEDGIIGEEHAPANENADFKWVIDPIDGTTNFVNGIPNWTIVLAGVWQQQTQLGVIHDPCLAETFSARRGSGAELNGASLHIPKGKTLSDGTVAVGFSNRVTSQNVVPVIDELLSRRAMFHRNASGALSLAYVSAGRLLGYLEEHMNAWDCLAGQLLVQEAGGMIEDQNADQMIREGGRVIVGSVDVFEDVKEIALRAWSN